MRQPLPAMTAMSMEQTEQVLQAHGLHQPGGTGFAVRRPRVRTAYDWHKHSYHQLMFAISGPSQVETDAGRTLVAQGQGAWIPAGLPHRSVVLGADGGSLFFDPERVEGPGRLGLLRPGPVLGEMVMLAMRWPIEARDPSPLADSLFRTLALLCAEWSAGVSPPALASSSHPRLRRAMDYTLADLAGATQTGAAQAAALSPRTLRRLFERETGGGWRDWMYAARMEAACGLLQDGRRVTDVAADVGYASLSAFAKAFTAATGETPLRFQQAAGVGRPKGRRA